MHRDFFRPNFEKMDDNGQAGDLTTANGAPCDCDDEDCDCGHAHDDELEMTEPTIVMVDAETGDEYTFILADDFVFEDQHYCVLITDDDDDPEWVITKVVTDEDGNEGLMSLDEAEYDAVYAEYDRICEEPEDDEED